MKKITLLTVVFLFTFSINAQTAIQEFYFNGTLSNTKNDVSFSGDGTFVNGRTGFPNSAIRISNSSIEATVLNLPVANSSRTVSVWVKYNDITKTNYVWGYGSSYNARFFGLNQEKATDSNSHLNLVGYGEENDVVVSVAVVPNVWYNYVVTYDGLTSKIYRNGELVRSSESRRKLTSGIVFSIGKMGSSVSIDADIDDLKIYDIALSDVEVIGLFKSNSILPPKNIPAVSASKTVKAKTTSTALVAEGGGKSFEIFSTKGIKVLASNTPVIDISTIPDGTYLLQIINVLETADKKITENTASVRNEKIVLNVPVLEEKAKYFEIYSTKGSKVFAGDSNGIDIGSIPQGTYSLKIINKSQNPIDKTITSY